MREVEIMQEEVDKPKDDGRSNSSSKKGSSSIGNKSGQLDKTQVASVKSISSDHVKKASQS